MKELKYRVMLYKEIIVGRLTDSVLYEGNDVTVVKAILNCYAGSMSDKFYIRVDVIEEA